MKENKLGAYLTSFTDKDWAAYHKFSKSLYSESSDFQLVINYIKKHKSRHDSNYMDGEYLRKKIRPNANKQVFANVISNLCKHIERYLIWAEVENDPMMKDTLLLQAIGKRGLTEQFHKQKQKAKLKRDKMPIGLWHHYHGFMAEYLHYYCNITTNISTGKHSLKKAFDEIKKFTSPLLHYLVLEMHNRVELLKENWDTQIQEFKGRYKLPHELTIIIGHLIKLKAEKSELSYKFLIKEVENSVLSQEIRFSIIIHLLSFITYNRIIGNNSYQQDMIELQDYGLRNNILFPSGKIPAARFINIVHRACGVKEYIWAKEFIINYSGLVPNETKKSIQTLGLAQIESSKGNYGTVLQLLSNNRYKIFEQEMRAKWLILSSSYELNKDNYNTIEYSVNNFKYFIKKNKQNTTDITYKSLLNTAKHLMNIAKGKDFQKVENYIKNEKNIFFRKWLLEKITEKK